MGVEQDAITQDSSEELITRSDPAEKDSLVKFTQLLRQKNRNHFMKKILFNIDYCRFITNMIHTLPNKFSLGTERMLSSETVKGALNVFKFSLNAFLTVILRLLSKNLSYECLRNLSTIIAEDREAAEYCLHTLSNKKIIQEFLLECPSDDVRKVFSALIRKTFRSVFNFEQHILSAQNGNGRKIIKLPFYFIYFKLMITWFLRRIMTLNQIILMEGPKYI